MKKNMPLPLLLLFAASLVLSIWFALHVPLNGNPDESSHRDYIRLLIENRGFVRFVPVPVDTDFGDKPTPWETHQPPLYYLLCVPVHLLSGGSLFAVRMVSALLQLLTIWVAYRAARDLFPNRPELWLGAAAFVTFLPTQAQLSAAISNDGLTTLICAALFWRTGLLVRNGQQTLRDALIIAALFGAGLLTKVSVLQLTPALLVAYFLAVRSDKLSLQNALKFCGIAVAGGFLIASPWLVRNTLFYGDPLALSIYKLTGPNLTPAAAMELSARFGPRWATVDYARMVGVRSFATFWYLLPPNLPLNGRFVGPPLPLLAVVVLALGGLAGAYQRAKQTKEGSKKEAEETAGERRVVGLFALGIAFLVPFFAQFVFSVFQAQGRYFLPILLPAAVLTVLGWAQWTKARPALGVGVVTALLFALVIWKAL